MAHAPQSLQASPLSKQHAPTSIAPPVATLAPRALGSTATSHLRQNITGRSLLIGHTTFLHFSSHMRSTSASADGGGCAIVSLRCYLNGTASTRLRECPCDVRVRFGGERPISPRRKNGAARAHD